MIFIVHPAWGASEAYFLGEQQVLLYKIINWWYFAPAGQSAELCGESISYENSGNARVDINSESSAAEISISTGCADMLSLITPCESCASKISVPSVWIDQNLFPDSKATLLIEVLAHTNNCSIIFQNVPNDTQKLLEDSQIQLVLTISGTVQGLTGSRIALDYSGDSQGKCRGSMGAAERAEPPAVTVKLSGKNPPLVRFNLWTGTSH